MNRSITVNLAEVKVDGSNDPLTPTDTRATESGFRITGKMGLGDPDYFYIDVPEHMVLEGIWLESYVSVDPIAFYALQAGKAFTAGLDTSKMLTWSHLNDFDIGKNLVSNISFIGLDEFVFWIQQTGAPTEYSVVISFEPKPGLIIRGTDASELLSGTDASEALFALAGDDTISSSLRRDTIDGGPGRDTVTYKNKYADYTARKTWDGSFAITATSGSSSIIPPPITEGEDKLVGVERIKFVDLSLALDTDPLSVELAKLMFTLFGREGLQDTKLMGLAFFLADSGYSSKEIASIAIPFLTQDNTSESFVKKIWLNLTGTEPETYVLNELVSVVEREADQGGLSREDLILLSASLEWTGLQLEFTGLWNTGLLYEPLNG